jgi:hypothetical protein
MRALFFVGPTKTGTTAIWHALKSHGIQLPVGSKEIFYFDKYYSSNRNHYFAQTFHLRRTSLIPEYFVEVSPSYFCSAVVPERIRTMFPSSRIVITLREPLSRTVSCFLHSSRYRTLDLMRALEEDEDLSASRYRVYCARWLDVFGPSNVLVARQNVEGAFADDLFPLLAHFSGIHALHNVKMEVRRYNEAVVSRSKRVARIVGRMNYYLRRKGASWLVDAARQLGIRSLVYKRIPTASAAVDKHHLLELETILHEEIVFYNALEQPATYGQELRRMLVSVCGSGR